MFQNTKVIALGNGDFRELMPIQKVLRTNSLKQKISGLKWFIVNGEWDRQQAEYYFKNLQSSNAIQLFLYGNCKPYIIQEIKNVKFPNLKSIMLSNPILINKASNGIFSIQSLQLLHFPLLKQLWLGSNSIVSTKSLRKVNSSLLRKICLGIYYINYYRITDNNKIQQIDEISQMKLGILQKMYLSSKKQNGTLLSIDSFFWKLESSQIQELEYKSDKQIQSQRRINMRRLKMSQMNDY